MIRVTATGFKASVSGPVVYLDNWAIAELAEKDPVRRNRFIEAVHSGVELLFSVTNATELSGPQGRSADLVKSFLQDIGPHWFPVALNATEVVMRELKGESPEGACVDEDFFKSYVVHQMRKSEGKVSSPSDYLLLGAVMDWVGPQRASIDRGRKEMDEALRSKIDRYVQEYKRNKLWLDTKFPSVPFLPKLRAHFTYTHLIRTLVIEQAAIKKNDGLDFCHTVIASAFSSFAALDKHWKRRVESLPKPNGLAHIYYQPELDKLVADMEIAARGRGLA
jgi:hypothetical protein